MNAIFFENVNSILKDTYGLLKTIFKKYVHVVELFFYKNGGNVVDVQFEYPLLLSDDKHKLILKYPQGHKIVFF